MSFSPNQERARLLQEFATRTFEATNLNLYIVSLLTAIFLPLTLITGIFGMNVAVSEVNFMACFVVPSINQTG